MDKLNKHFMANPKVWLKTNELCEHKFLQEAPPEGAKASLDAGRKIINEEKVKDAEEAVPTPLEVTRKALQDAKNLKVESNRELLGAGESWRLTRRAAIIDFDLAPVTIEKRAMAMLRLFDAPSAVKDLRVASGSGRRITAYWVPYRSTGTGYAPIKLGAAANYMFTNALTGCRITIVPDAVEGLKAPLVMHIAGSPPDAAPGADKGKAWRNTVEAGVIAGVMPVVHAAMLARVADAKVPEAKVPEAKPRLVYSYSSTALPKDTGYEGMNGVIFIGIRDAKTGVWSFVGQWRDDTGLHLRDAITGATL